jgi:hypothetical protein
MMRTLPLSARLEVKRMIWCLIIVVALFLAREACLRVAVWIGGGW